MSKFDNKSLKILQVISTPPFAWATGGCARVVYDLSIELAKRGHQITILTTDLYKPNQRYPKDLEVVDNIKIIRFRYISNFLAWNHKIYISPGMISYLKNHLSEYDVVHLHDLLSLQSLATSKYCKKYNKPFILTSHGSLPFLVKNKLLYGLLFQRIIFGAHKVTALSKGEFSKYISLGLNEKKIVIIPNGINMIEFPVEIGSFRKKYGISKNQKIILYLGRIHKTKGIDKLIRIFAKIPEDMGVTLVIVGPDDGYLRIIKNQANKLKIADRIIFTGPIYGEEKITAYFDSDVFVTPKFSGFPVTFLESCLCGTPIITTNETDSLDWINNVVGYVVAENNEKNLLERIVKVLREDNLRNKFRHNSKSVIKKFLWINIAENFENLYKSVLDV